MYLSFPLPGQNILDFSYLYVPAPALGWFLVSWETCLLGSLDLEPAPCRLLNVF